jgi:hypothetical protein
MMPKFIDPEQKIRELRNTIMDFHHSLGREEALKKLAELGFWLGMAKPKEGREIITHD